MKKQRILLIGGNYCPEPTGIGKYNGEMIGWLSAQGHECTVITSYPYYPYWQVQAPYAGKAFWYTQENRATAGGATIKIYRCPHYVPSTPTGARRILSDFSFLLSAFFQVLLLLFRKKYDYVLTVAPPFQVGLLGLLYKKLKGSTLIYHVQDLQIDAAHELGMIKSKGLVKTLFGLERIILKSADCVSSISEGMIRKIKAKQNRTVVLFPNWADTETFYPLAHKEGLKKEFGFSAGDKIVLYSGAIGEKQGLQTLLHCADRLKHEANVKILICGSGPYKQKLMNQAGEMGLHNVFFMPLQPQEKFNRFLNLADVHLVLQKANANDLVMPSKLTGILSVGGLVIVASEPHTSLHSVISRHALGLLVPPEDETALCNAIEAALKDEGHEALKQNAREYAMEYLTMTNVVAKYFSDVFPQREDRIVMEAMERRVFAKAVN